MPRKEVGYEFWGDTSATLPLEHICVGRGGREAHWTGLAYRVASLFRLYPAFQIENCCALSQHSDSKGKKW